MKYLYMILGNLIWITPAYAYLDPGTGSLIIQSVIAVVVGASFTIKLYWYKIKSFFVKGKDVAVDTRDVVDSTKVDETADIVNEVVTSDKSIDK